MVARILVLGDVSSCLGELNAFMAAIAKDDRCGFALAADELGNAAGSGQTVDRRDLIISSAQERIDERRFAAVSFADDGEFDAILPQLLDRPINGARNAPTLEAAMRATELAHSPID